MKTLVCLFVVFIFEQLSYAADPISPADAANYIGRQATVCGIVANAKYVTTTRGTPTFLNLDKPYPNHIFTVVIWGSDRERFSYRPETLSGSRICVSGRIIQYRGKPEIIASDPQQITITDKDH